MSATVSASRRAMSPAEIKALAEETTVTDVPTAARALGISRSTAYELVARGEFPCPVVKAGRRYVVPVAGLLALLDPVGMVLGNHPTWAEIRAAVEAALEGTLTDTAFQVTVDGSAVVDPASE